MFGWKAILFGALIVVIGAALVVRYSGHNDDETLQPSNNLTSDVEEVVEETLPDDLSGMTISKSDDGRITLYAGFPDSEVTSPEFSTYIQYELNGDTITDCLYPFTRSDYVCLSDLEMDSVSFRDGAVCGNRCRFLASSVIAGFCVPERYLSY